MNQFEFLRSIPFGQYIPTDSAFHRVDPRARLVGFSIFLLALTLAPHLTGICAGLILVLIAIPVGHISFRYVLRGLLSPLPFLLVLVLLQVLFNASTDPGPVLLQIGPLWVFGTIQITPADLWAGLRLLARFNALILGLGLVSFTFSTSEMISGLNALLGPLGRIGLPAQDLAMMAQVTLRFIPLLAQTAERIAKAQASRGADWDARPGNLIVRVRQILPVIVPLFLNSLRKAEAMALAMDARAYGSAATRSSMIEFRFTWLDGVILAGVIGLSASLLII